MASSAPKPVLTPEEYLEFESKSAERHEYLRGGVFGMTGTTDAHNDVASNVHAAIRAHLRGSPCRAYFADVRLRIEAADAYFYPDVFVTCDEADRADPIVKRSAKVVVEVLSESTAAYDLGEKFDEYRRLDSLLEYVLVDSRRRHAVVYRRRTGGVWEFDPVTLGGTLRLESIGLTLSMATLYEDTDVPEKRLER